jgi:hypothetical protein
VSPDASDVRFTEWSPAAPRANGPFDPLKAPPAAEGDYDWASSSEAWPSGRRTADTVSASPYRWTDPSQIPPRQWLHARHFVRKYLSVTVSAGGIGKSSLELVDAISMVSGRDLLSGKKIPARTVWYWNGEDPLEELRRRVQTIALRYRLSQDDFGGRLFLDSGREQQIVVAREEHRHGVIVNRPLITSITEILVRHQVDVLILDPFISTHAVPENDNGAIDRVAKELAGIAEIANCSVEVAHHVRKGNGAEFTVDDARGAVALIGAARSVRILNSMGVDEAAKAGVDPAQRRLYFRVDNGKSNLAPPGAEASWCFLKSIGLGNGADPYPEDSVGVVEAWTWPDAFAGLTADHLKQVQNKIGNGRWRADVQAGAWVGKAVANVLGLNLDDPADKAKVKLLLKTCLKSGALVEVERLDDGRKIRRFVEVGTWVET